MTQNTNSNSANNSNKTAANSRPTNLEKFYTLMNNLEKSASNGDWNKVIYYAVSIRNAASGFKARKAARRARATV